MISSVTTLSPAMIVLKIKYSLALFFIVVIIVHITDTGYKFQSRVGLLQHTAPNFLDSEPSSFSQTFDQCIRGSSITHMSMVNISALQCGSHVRNTPANKLFSSITTVGCFYQDRDHTLVLFTSLVVK